MVLCKGASPVKGHFITFEGPDGSGKTTQIHKFAVFLENENIPYILTREPGGTKVGDRIRSLLLDPIYTELRDETEVLLYAASRAQHVREVIKPALEEGRVVLCDRFIDASIAYQGYGLELSVDSVISINQFAVAGLIPDRTYLLDISPEKARERMINRGEKNGKINLDRIEQKHLAYHQRVREGFYQLYREDKQQRMCLIDGNNPADMVFQMILDDFKTWYGHKITKKG
jgi:dTMP kinase